VPAADGVIASSPLLQLSPGASISSRYEIVRLLGQGGMGAVYQAHDKELERQVAIKVIRADMAANPEILRRFKQELILARQITHKNVIRIFDLGQADGVKFITMEYIEGENLQIVLRRKKKLAPAEAANILAQVCRALEAAHNEGVIHRDLKPQNIMLDKTGRAYVMDFGIARSMLGAGMTQTGALIGTPDYMSPEQAKGQSLDARSDLFSVGIIFYEMLSGQVPFNADTTMGKLWMRTNVPARPLGELDKTIPQPLSDIVRKCLEIDPQKRFASAAEMLQHIEMWLGPAAGTRIIAAPLAALPAYTKWVAASLGVVVIAGILFFRSRVSPFPMGPHPPVTLLIADFDNKTGDSVFDGTLEPMLGIALEGAPFISSFNRGQAKKDGLRLQPGATRMDAALSQLVAVREGVNVVVTGSITQVGSGYKVYVATLDPATGKSILTEQRNASSKQDVLAAAGKLAESIRKGLGDTTPESVQLSAAGTFTTSSLEAAHAYALAQDLQWAGKWEEAIPHYEQAIQFDPNLGRAYAGLASTSENMGRRKDAEKYYQLALAHIDRMSDREKYRTRGGYYLANREPRKAIEEYLALVQQFPSDGVGYSNLALAYFYLRDMPKALEEGRHAVELLPKALLQLNNLALYAVYAGDFATAADQARKVIAQNSSYVNAYGALAMAQTGLGQAGEAEQTYSKMAAISARGLVMAMMGRADLLLYQGRTKEANTLLQKAFSTPSVKADDSTLAAQLLVLAEAKLAEGEPSEAVADAKSALTHDNGGTVQFSAGRIYIEAGQDAAAQLLASQLSSHLDPDDQAYAKLLEAEANLKRGDARRAVASFEEAQKLADTWIGRFDLGRAYIAMGAYTEADSEFERCMKRRGEASAMYLDDVPTFRAFPPTYYYLGRAQEGLKSPAAADSYKSFLSIKEKGDELGLIVDARRRLAGH